MVASTQLSSVSPSEPVEALIEEVGLKKPEEEAPLTREESTDNGRKRDSMEAMWARASALMAADEIVEALVSGHNKGGLLVRWEGIQGFVPASQLVGLAGLHVEEERRAALEARHGEMLQLKMIEVDRSTNRLIFSERATEVTASARDDLLRELAPGQVRVGVVTNMADFGAFVDLGGVEGLVHISELSWRRLTHPGDVVRPGQKVNVLVMEVDARRGRVALSRKKLRQDPWLGVEERYQTGQRVHGEVTNVADFGVFVLVEEGLEGLVHVSELAELKQDESAQTLVKGAQVSAEVIYVSERKRRLALTLCKE